MGLWKSFLRWLAGPEETKTPKAQPAPAEVKPPSPAAPAARPVQPRPSPSTPIVVGLDFGTYSTKVVVRPRGEPTAEVVRIEEPAPGYPCFAAPSLVRSLEGQVFFGREALCRSGGKLYKSLKVCLLPPKDGVAPRQPLLAGSSPDLLVSLYLSWVLHSLRTRFQARKGHEEPSVFLNMAAPMNHVEDARLKDRYLRIIHAAWESVFGGDPFPVQQGMAIRQLTERFQPWLQAEVPDLTVRHFEVLPETVAPIVSLSLDPRMAPGMYLIVDIGAGTTEISVNHVGERGADQRVACYADESTLFGGDSFNWADNHFRDNPAALTSCRDNFLSFLARFLKRKWAEGYLKDAPSCTARKRWQELTVLLTGGGARRPDIEKTVNNTSPIYPWPASETKRKVCWHRPRGIRTGPSMDQADEDLPLLSVAHGLSVPRQQWPDCFPPGAIDQLPADRPPEGPPPYWYVDH